LKAKVTDLTFPEFVSQDYLAIKELSCRPEIVALFLALQLIYFGNWMQIIEPASLQLTPS